MRLAGDLSGFWLWNDSCVPKDPAGLVREVVQPPKGSLQVALTCTTERGGTALGEGAVNS